MGKDKKVSIKTGSGHIKRCIPIIIYALILIISLIMINNFGGVHSYVLFFSALVYPVISFIYMLYIKGVLRIYQELDGRLLYKSRAEKYSLTIENSGPLVIGGIRLSTSYGMTIFSNDFTVDSFELLPHEKKEIHTDVILKYAGSYEAGITMIVLRDILGIINIRYHIPAPLRVSVLPAVTDVASRPLDRLLDEMLSGRKMITKEQREETLGNDIKAYTAGDPLKQIHWKNYARSGELFIRLPDIPETQMPTVLLIPERSDKSLEAIERRDFFLEYAVSIANYFAKRKKPVTFIFEEEDAERILVEDYISFQKFYTGLENRIKNAEKMIPDNRESVNEISGESLLILREKDNQLCMNKKGR